MKIEDSHIKLIEKWINSHWEESTCLICKNNNWAIGKTIAELRPFLKGKLRVGGPVSPVVLLTCNVCGNTLFFSAMTLGIVKLPPPKKDDGVVAPPDKVMPPKEVVPPKEVASPAKVTPLKEKEGDDNG